MLNVVICDEPKYRGTHLASRYLVSVLIVNTMSWTILLAPMLHWSDRV